MFKFVVIGYCVYICKYSNTFSILKMKLQPSKSDDTKGKTIV